MILSHGSTGNHSDHFAMHLITYALGVIIFALENVSRPKTQHILLEDDEEEVFSRERNKYTMGSDYQC